MKAFRIASFAVLAVLSGGRVHAQSTNDPVIRTGGGRGSVAITSPFFRVVSPSGTSPVLPNVQDSTDCVLLQPGEAPTSVPGCFFKNKIVLPDGAGVTITRLVFVVDNADFSGILTCDTNTQLGGPGPFAVCRVHPVGDGSLSIVTFFKGSVPFGSDFSMGMRSFNSNTGFVGVALGNAGLAAGVFRPSRENSAAPRWDDPPRLCAIPTRARRDLLFDGRRSRPSYA